MNNSDGVNEKTIKMCTAPDISVKEIVIPEKETERETITLDFERENKDSERNKMNTQNNEIKTQGNIFSTEGDEEYASAEEYEVIDTERARRGPGRPKLIRTGSRGRPRKDYNMINLIVTEENPQTVKEAMSSRYKEEWLKAMKAEIKALLDNKTWEMTELPKNQKAVGNKWVFTVKKDEHNNVERFKARLVAKGCSQKYGVNYTETFSPVARYETIRILLAIAVEYNLYVHQMDVSTAYLNSDLREDVYMRQPDVWLTIGQTVCES